MKNLDAIKAKIDEISLSEDFVRSEAYAGGKHVCLLFSDGELASTKAGSLLHQRNLHCLEFGNAEKKVPDSLFPQRMGEHGYVFCDHKKGEELRAMILAD